MPHQTPYGNIALHLLPEDEALAACTQCLDRPGRSHLFFVNAHCFNVAQRDAAYRDALRSAELVFCDGIGMKLGSYFLGVRIPANLNGTDLIPKLLARCAGEQRRVFLLGGEPGVAEKARANLQARIPGLKVVGVCDGFSPQETTLEAVRSSGAELLVVGMGVPRQELFLEKHRGQLGSVSLAIAGGAILDFTSGRVPRAPAWMRAIKLEWLYRLSLEPARLWRRYVLGIPLFFWYLARSPRRRP